ncbi:gas vesicle protein GvpG [Metabacillus sp. GX 13764]|uniref:gas vesicle protein GvpG n=1 Tax=Metabacillus kandeliae TaxID=2900151 RepID=UPI001E4296AF|nr:gas vesicle protein GvpG [Metabacillus kandeliae]MCD7033534.1 gas vesicle protein GvpG [Metabacillus kandeliae]
MIQKLFTAPFDLLIKVGEKVQEEADKEMYDLETIQKKLVHLELMLEMDEVSEEEYKESEEELLERYEIAKLKEQEQFYNRG